MKVGSGSVALALGFLGVAVLLQGKGTKAPGVRRATDSPLLRRSGMRNFPVPIDAKPLQFASRFGDGHEGIDIFAPRDTAVLAVADGIARQATDRRGGKVIYLEEPDGTRYYYAHLDDYDKIRDKPRAVLAGDLLGFVGTTGNAKGKAPHIHFELRPNGGAKVDPFEELSRVLEDERAALGNT